MESSLKQQIAIVSSIVLVSLIIFGGSMWMFGPTVGPTVVSAQQTQTIYKQILSNASSASPIISANVPSIGQSQHFAFVKLSNNGSHGCAPNPGLAPSHQVTVVFQASYDNSTFFQLGNASLIFQTGNANFFQNLYTAGIAPYVRLAVMNMDNTNCVVNAFYGGSLFPITVDRGSFSGGGVLPGFGLETVQYQQVGATTQTVIPTDPTGNGLYTRAVSIYGMSCSTQGAQEVDFGATFPGSNYSFWLAANGTVVWPPVGAPYISVPNLTVTTSAATNMNCTFMYRYE